MQRPLLQNNWICGCEFRAQRHFAEIILYFTEMQAAKTKKKQKTTFKVRLANRCWPFSVWHTTMMAVHRNRFPLRAFRSVSKWKILVFHWEFISITNCSNGKKWFWIPYKQGNGFSFNRQSFQRFNAFNLHKFSFGRVS